ncbi:MAG TPA: GIY-YIG nuclease family protein, partial [Candidatus Paceibacterota bacterium]|nr:GIY-YIG nuclease family protein [Candidatus Paceibacterota bacterium]
MKNNDNKEKGVVYILTNEAMPGYVKIGKTTTSVEQRMLELSRSSAVPLPFECYYAARVADVGKVEEAFHDAFGDHRINPRREFFNIAPERVVAILKLLSLEEVTPSHNAGIESKEDAVAIDVARKKRSAFNFKIVNIPIGAELNLARDEKITCLVAPDQK